MQDHAREAETLEKKPEHVHDFGIQHRVINTKGLGIDLVELTVSAFLRPFVAKHGADAVQLPGQRVGLQIVLNERAHHRCRGLGPQGEHLAFAVRKGIHFLFDDIGAFSDAARKKIEFFNHGSADFPVTEAGENLSCRLFDPLPPFDLVGQKVVHASYGLDGLHYEVSSV